MAVTVNITNSTNESYITGTLHQEMRKKVHVAPKKQGKKKKKGLAKEMNLTLLSVSCRSNNKKKPSIKELLDTQNVDVALCSELNLNWKPPKFKGFVAFQKKSKKRARI